MSAAPGNSNARKWTDEKVKECLHKIEQAANSADILYLSEALILLGLGRRVWSYWRKICSQNEDIMEHMDLIDTIFEVKLFKGALKGTIHATSAIFGLKHNHHWSDKPVLTTEPSEGPKGEMWIVLDHETVILTGAGNANGKFKRACD